ncbi:MAG: hypothetical protein M9928_09505 [Anaerolineae bacterium]|nr:hypothetical protein [Anaerolineae bacterium]
MLAASGLFAFSGQLSAETQWRSRFKPISVTHLYPARYPRSTQIDDSNQLH